MKQSDVTIINFSDLDTEEKRDARTRQEEEKTDPESSDEEFTSATNPELVNSESTLELAKDVGFYTKSSEEHQSPVDAAEQVDEANDERMPTG